MLDTSDLPEFVLAQLSIRPGADFVCAICQHNIEMRWNPKGPRANIPPLCWSCENESGYDWAGRARNRSKPSGGNFLDRRKAVQILALAEAIEQQANRVKYAA